MDGSQAPKIVFCFVGYYYFPEYVEWVAVYGSITIHYP